MSAGALMQYTATLPKVFLGLAFALQGSEMLAHLLG